MEINKEKYRYKELADFLKTRRAKILPSQVGLPTTLHRRTPGLRREEVAQVAGIGLSWYTWLEQGRSIHVSVSVLESLSRTLLLDNNERKYLYYLANQPIPNEEQEIKSEINPMLQHVIDHLELCPSLIIDKHWNVVAWNKEADLLLGKFENMDERERNIVWAMFTNDKYKKLYLEWEVYAKRLLGNFRATCGEFIEDAWFMQFVEDLQCQSNEFRLWWSLHEIEDSSEKYKKINHPIVGELEFEVSNFSTPDDTELKMIVHVPALGTDTAEKLKLLSRTSM